jgi:hypothetical protein
MPDPLPIEPHRIPDQKTIDAVASNYRHWRKLAYALAVCNCIFIVSATILMIIGASLSDPTVINGWRILCAVAGVCNGLALLTTLLERFGNAPREADAAERALGEYKSIQALPHAEAVPKLEIARSHWARFEVKPSCFNLRIICAFLLVIGFFGFIFGRQIIAHVRFILGAPDPVTAKGDEPRSEKAQAISASSTSTTQANSRPSIDDSKSQPSAPTKPQGNPTTLATTPSTGQTGDGVKSHVMTLAADNGAQNAHRLFFVQCKGGPADGQYSPLAHRPDELLKASQVLVWTTNVAEYFGVPDAPPAADKKKEPMPTYAKQGSTLYTYIPANTHFMDCGDSLLYQLQRAGNGQIILDYVGSVSRNQYLKLCKPSEYKLDSLLGGPVAAEDNRLLYTANSGAFAPQKVFPVKCIDGLAKGQNAPLLYPPSELFEASLNEIIVYDQSPYRDLAPGFSLSQRKHLEYLARVHVYSLKKMVDNSFQLENVGEISATDYLPLASVPKPTGDR